MGRGTVQGSHCLKWRRKARLLHRTFVALAQSNLRLSPQRALLPYSTGNCFSNESDDSFIDTTHAVSYLWTVDHTLYLCPSMLSILSLPPARVANPFIILLRVDLLLLKATLDPQGCLASPPVPEYLGTLLSLYHSQCIRL